MRCDRTAKESSDEHRRRRAALYIHLDDKYGSLSLIDIPAEIAAHQPWFNQTLTTVNDAVVRLFSLA